MILSVLEKAYYCYIILISTNTCRQNRKAFEAGALPLRLYSLESVSKRSINLTLLHSFFHLFSAQISSSKASHYYPLHQSIASPKSVHLSKMRGHFATAALLGLSALAIAAPTGTYTTASAEVTGTIIEEHGEEVFEFPLSNGA